MDWSMDIQLAGQPPEKFTFASDAAASIRLGGRTSDPIDVYRQIAQSAFQRFSLVLQKQFGVYGLPRYNPSNPYGGLGTYRRRPSANPYVPRPYVPPPSPLTTGAGTPTGSASIDNFVAAMPPTMRAAYMAKPHFKRRIDTIKLWTQLDRMYFRLPYKIRRRYTRLSSEQRRLRMLNLLERNKNRAPVRKRPANDDPFGP
jgi:hypothetical protein